MTGLGRTPSGRPLDDEVGPDGRPGWDDEARWQAVLARDPAADGLFFYGVKSTGVYCRPTCPARRPKRSQVVFFDTAGEAERGGFRPCLRCRPGVAPGPSENAAIVALVRQLLDTQDPSPTLAQLGQAAGLSPHYLQRLFKRATGLSPREYAAARRAELLRTGLRRGNTVTAALYEAGYGSVRAAYEKAGEYLGMSPGVYKQGGRGLLVRFTVTDTPLGPMLLAATAGGICALRFADLDGPAGADLDGPAGRLSAQLRAEFPRARLVEDPAGLGEWVDAVLGYLRGERRDLNLPLDIAASTFRLRVWQALRDIPYGSTQSYAAVAKAVGAPGASRAVGQACAANPVALLVPCHRVVLSGGQLGGYRWGLDRKRRLLDEERKRT
jgi:AraC family transcriptional regulator of adaptative response/methylated-DNA-[protein]-cysteine methyltransferase